MAYSFDGSARTITLSAQAVMSVRDVYSRWADWLALSDNVKYLPAFRTVGGDDIDPSAGTTVPIYALLQNGWRIQPMSADHTLAVTDGILLVEGGGDPFITPPGGHAVRINYQQPVQAITVATGGAVAGLKPEEYQLLLRLAKIHGLVEGVPSVVGPTSRVAGDVVQNISETAGVVTVELQ